VPKLQNTLLLVLLISKLDLPNNFQYKTDYTLLSKFEEEKHTRPEICFLECDLILCLLCKQHSRGSVYKYYSL